MDSCNVFRKFFAPVPVPAQPETKMPCAKFGGNQASNPFSNHSGVSTIVLRAKSGNMMGPPCTVCLGGSQVEPVPLTERHGLRLGIQNIDTTPGRQACSLERGPGYGASGPGAICSRSALLSSRASLTIPAMVSPGRLRSSIIASTLRLIILLSL